MHRVVVLGRGGAGKSALAACVGARYSLPVVELDRHFWSADLDPLGRVEWVRRQRELCASKRWVMDGDLGRYDVLEPRLTRADVVIVLDYSLLRCVWQAARRSRERRDFWWWVLTWRLVHRPRIRREVERYAPLARVITLRRPQDFAAVFAG